MSLLELAIATTLPLDLPGSQESVLPFPPYVFAITAAAVFIFLAFVVWSFRDVANRHSQRTGGNGGHGAGQGSAAHSSTGHGSAEHH